MPRVSALVHLYLLGTLGVFLVAAPWTPVWDQAIGGLSRTWLASWIGSGYARGLVSGIGVLDLLWAMAEGESVWRSYRDARRERAG